MSNVQKKYLQSIFSFLKAFILPVLFAIVPTLYHYSNNVVLLTLSNLSRMLALNAMLAVLFYFINWIFQKSRTTSSAIGTCIFLIYFNLYGLLYRYLLDLDVVRVKHYTLLPLILMMAVYSIWLINKLAKSDLSSVWNYLMLVTILIIVFNLAKIIPAEFRKWDNRVKVTKLESQGRPASQEYPDIYFIVFDEFAGFQAMREYWGYQDIDKFINFLVDQGFFVAESSHSSSTVTLHEMASRLNYHEYHLEEKRTQTYYNDIADNRVMRYLKSMGYTTVVFDERKLGFPAATSIVADYSFEYGSPSIPRNEITYDRFHFYFDEFGELVMDNTMIYVFSEKYKADNPWLGMHSDMINFTVTHINSVDIPSPKFVFVHLLLPHDPFMFDRYGNITNYDRHGDWNYYLDNYIYSITIAEKIIRNIKAVTSYTDNPPVIILQSDHGARNKPRKTGGVKLNNYPNKFKTLILNALYIPGYDYSSLPQDIDPVETFPIVFNYLFNTNIVVK